jgi:hypothetical protein
MRFRLATLLRFALAATASFAPSQAAPQEASGQHIRLSARCDPPIVQAGGWVDVVIDGRTDPGWHITSPLSKGGQRASVELELPEGFVPAGRLRAPPGRERHDVVFGTVEILEDRFELRQHVRVPEKLAASELNLRGTSLWIVCDPARCLPPQRLELCAPLKIDPGGARGPNPSIGEPQFQLRVEERALLAAEGFVARASPELERVSPGECLFVALDLAFDAAKFESVSRAGLGPAKDSSPEGEGWVARESTVECDGGKQCRALRTLLPLRVAAETERAEIEVPIEIVLRPAVAGESDVVRVIRLVMPIER